MGVWIFSGTTHKDNRFTMRSVVNLCFSRVTEYEAFEKLVFFSYDFTIGEKQTQVGMLEGTVSFSQ